MPNDEYALAFFAGRVQRLRRASAHPTLDPGGWGEVPPLPVIGNCFGDCSFECRAVSALAALQGVEARVVRR